ncbi:MAG: amidohydrolase family protein [Rhodospirillaceae bacterium]|nr:amidohydrolase family protein [Rhodospirillaceae bacterium]
MMRISSPLAAALAFTPLLAVCSALQSAHAQAPAAATALIGARLFDGTGSAPIESSAVVIRDGRIEAAGAADTVTVPADAVRVDLSGKTLLPGLINAHGHLGADQSDRPVRDKLIGQLRVYADYGVTTVVVLGTEEGDLEEAVRLRREQDSGDLDRARVYVAGPSLQALRTAEEARSRVNAYADAGVDIIKIHITGGPNDMTPAVYGALIEQAHMRGLGVAAHLYYLDDAHGLLDAGVDVIAHSVRDQDVDAALIAKIRQRDVPYIATFTRDLAQFVYETTPAFFDDPFFLRHVDAFRPQMTLLNDTARQEETRNSPQRQAMKPALEQGMRNLQALSDAGVLIAMGSDSGANLGQWQGYFEHTELEMMVDAGMSPAQALVSATGDAARAMGLDEELGTVQPGRRADLLVLDANPLEDIRATREIDSVWIAGRRLEDLP